MFVNWAEQQLENDQDRQVTVNGNRYRSMITEYFWSQLDDMDLEDMWFQQDGATSHTANVTINLLDTQFVIVLSHEMVQSVGRLGRAI